MTGICSILSTQCYLFIYFSINSYQFKLFLYFSYDVVLTGGPSDVVRAFKKFGAKILMSAEGFCWPDSSLAVSIWKYAH